MASAPAPMEIFDGGAELIPTRHAISTALRRIEAGWRPDSDEHWTRQAWDMIRRNRLTVGDMRRILQEGMQRDTLVTCDERLRKRGSRTTTTFDVTRMCPDIFVADDVEERVIVMRREICEVHRRNVEYRSTIAGIALHQHAIGRLYEREQLGHGDIIDRLRVDLARIETSTAFAHAAGLLISCDGDTHAPGSAGAIPLGEGMLIIRAIEVAARNASTARVDLVERGAIRMAGAPHPDVVNRHQVDGVEQTTHRLTLGITYLAYDDLRPEQRDYLAVFEDAMADHDLAAIASDIGRLWLPHEKPTPMPKVDVPPRLHDLLRSWIRIGGRQAVYTTKNWYENKDPDPIARPSGHHHLNWDIQRYRGG